MADSALRSGLPDVSYYSPTFRIAIEGTNLADPTLREILDLKVVMDMEQLTRFDFTIANPWHYRDDTAGNPQEATFKYSDTTLFDLGSLVHIEMGYADRLLPMMTGIITKLTPKFPESGPPTIAVSGQDNLVLLKNRKPIKGEPKYYTEKKDWQIAEVIARRHNLDFEATKDDKRAPEHDVVVQRNQDDATFLMERAKRIDYDCYIVVGTKDKKHKGTLFFLKPTDGRAGAEARPGRSGQPLTYEFKWGENLMSFTPELTAAEQVSRVTVKGWDAKTKSAITGSATKADLEGPDKNKGTSGPEVVETKISKKKEEVLVDWPVLSQAEAKALAVSLLRERAYRFLQATGQAIGLPDMRPGDNVVIKGIGQRFSGQYYVTRVEHSIGNNGYLTGFVVRRTHAEIPKKPEAAK